MMLISYMIQHYFGMPYQAFTEKIITAHALLQVVDGVNVEDVARLRWLQENTSEKVMVSMWKLDRSVNPSKGRYETTSNKRRFIRNDATFKEREVGDGLIELDEDAIQHYLCEVINEVHCIVAKNIKGYKEEIKIETERNALESKDGAFKFEF
jgi:hypothetical protein